MIINEIFYSLQGEGALVGVPSVFIRLAGCPVKCRWCDTAYAFSYDDGEDLTIEQISERINNCREGLAPPNISKYFVITGGEPLVNTDMTEREGLRKLTSFLKHQGGHITIETAGIAFVEGLDCDLMSISPKLTNSGTESGFNLDALQQLLIEYDCQFKFVVEDQKDVAEVEEVLTLLAGVDRSRVMLMPQAKSRKEYIEKTPLVAKSCIEYNFTFSPRLQVLLWDNEKGK